MISESADVDPSAHIGSGTRVWHLAQVREQARIGSDCIIGRGAYIDHGVVLGDHCKVQNLALVYAPATLGDGVFVGPGAILANDRHPRAITPDGGPKSGDDWTPSGVTVGTGAAIGAGAIVNPGVEIGEWALIASGAVVTKDVPAHALIAGVPGRRMGWVGFGGATVRDEGGVLKDPTTGDRFRVVNQRLELI